MRAATSFAILAAAVLAAPYTFAYEQATHALVSLRAWQLSNVAVSPTASEDLGLARYLRAMTDADKPFGDFYMDLGDEVRLREYRSYEVDFMPNALGFDPAKNKLKAEGWLLRGAIREDDTPVIPFSSNDDPVNAIRPLNHFFDPVHALPFTIGAQTMGATNPNWALCSKASSVVKKVSEGDASHS
jgi:hypothetical protein